MKRNDTRRVAAGPLTRPLGLESREMLGEQPNRMVASRAALAPHAREVLREVDGERLRESVRSPFKG